MALVTHTLRHGKENVPEDPEKTGSDGSKGDYQGTTDTEDVPGLVDVQKPPGVVGHSSKANGPKGDYPEKTATEDGTALVDGKDENGTGLDDTREGHSSKADGSKGDKGDDPKTTDPEDMTGLVEGQKLPGVALVDGKDENGTGLDDTREGHSSKADGSEGDHPETTGTGLNEIPERKTTAMISLPTPAKKSENGADGSIDFPYDVLDSPVNAMSLQQNIFEAVQVLVRGAELANLHKLSKESLIMFLAEYRGGEVSIPKDYQKFATISKKKNLAHLTKHMTPQAFDHFLGFVESLCTEEGLQKTPQLVEALRLMDITFAAQPTQTEDKFVFSLRDVSSQSQHKNTVGELSTASFLIIMFAMQKCSSRFVVPTTEQGLHEMAKDAGNTYDVNTQSFTAKVAGITQKELTLYKHHLAQMQVMSPEGLKETAIWEMFSSELSLNIVSVTDGEDSTYVISGVNKMKKRRIN